MVAKNIPIKRRADISRNVILVLLILTIVLSGISTWVVLDTINQVKQQYLSIPSIQKGYISVNILPKPGQSVEQELTPTIQNRVTGGVSFIVLERG